jgi:hypothetical protein
MYNTYVIDGKIVELTDGDVIFIIIRNYMFDVGGGINIIDSNSEWSVQIR